jgi:hypothetical protein
MVGFQVMEGVVFGLHLADKIHKQSPAVHSIKTAQCCNKGFKLFAEVF